MEPNGPETIAEKPFHVLSLDGGGAKGFYTLGILEELEALLGGRPLFERFELIFGTSTGAIIAALLALGRSTAEIHALYKKHVPTVMQPKNSKAKSAALEVLAREIFPTETFKDAHAARKVDQLAARKVDHLRAVHSTLF
jgi:patatin-like phospholipase/acyl hydrolase